MENLRNLRNLSNLSNWSYTLRFQLDFFKSISEVLLMRTKIKSSQLTVLNQYNITSIRIFGNTDIALRNKICTRTVHEFEGKICLTNNAFHPNATFVISLDEERN